MLEKVIDYLEKEEVILTKRMSENENKNRHPTTNHNNLIIRMFDTQNVGSAAKDAIGMLLTQRKIFEPNSFSGDGEKRFGPLRAFMYNKGASQISILTPLQLAHAQGKLVVAETLKKITEMNGFSVS